ncbi:MAG: UDP-N-acetylmuramate:L-alanyl-gamma-D-glutamyl-meso-diaminopimelate ligase [Vicinamibacteria bacterium]|nr:UDP-N-acetylmuramate:L-alanyl-gamma-D-glutamyl-meso-diaminopimelate ligase [Vicinamibacteria bacterium]
MKVHISGICGTAMASLAALLKAQGHELSGSDENVYPPMSTQLEALGIAIRSPYAAGNIPEDAELVVIGNALSRGNPEVEAVLDAKRRMTSLPALLSEQFLRERRSLVVAGTHGKTTTTSLLAFVLDRAGRAPSFLIGGVPTDFGISARLGAGTDFVIEGDEYDTAFFDKRPKFVHYQPDVAILGNVEYDHADIYPDLASVKNAFFRLLTVVPRRGLVVAGIESEAVRELLPRAFSRVATFALGAEADWRGDVTGAGSRGLRFRLRVRGADRGEYELGIPGEHNVRNALAALCAADDAGVSPEACRDALLAFRGVKRRQELRGEAGGVAVYDDFAHHPTAVRATLEALRPLVRGRLWCIFEPRSYTSRTRTFLDGFADAFTRADEVILAAVHLPGKVPEALRLSERDLVEAACARGARARFIGDVPAIVAQVAAEARPGDAVAVLSNGGFGGIHGRLLEALATAPRA